MEEEKVIVYSAKGCAPCKQAEKYLDEKGVNYEEKSAIESMESEEGSTVLTVPIICNGDECVTGFKPKEIDEKIID